MAKYASPIEIDIDDREMLMKFSQFENKAAETIRQTMLRAMQIVGLTAVEQHMVKAKLIDYKSGATIGTAGSKLNIRTSRLSRSLIGGFTFGQGLGGEQESIRKIVVVGKTVEGMFGTSVPYAAIHEYGGTVHPTITARARRFFWAMYKNTHLTMWKAMALTKKDNFSINIPARPYLYPAIEESRGKIEAMFQSAMKILSKAVSDE